MSEQSDKVERDIQARKNDGTWEDSGTNVDEREFDRERLRQQLPAIRAIMEDRSWHTLGGLREACAERGVAISEASVSARIRDLRKERNGGHTVDKDYIGRGLWQYRLVPPAAAYFPGHAL